MVRNALLTIHVLSIIAWIGVGFFELYLGRRSMAASGTALEAPLLRMAYGADLVVFGATLLAFAAGISMAIYEGYWFFTVLWLGIKQAIMIVVLVVVIGIFPTAIKLNAALKGLPPGPGPATPEIRALYRRLEPWYWLMRVLAVCAVVLAIWRPKAI